MNVNELYRYNFFDKIIWINSFYYVNGKLTYRSDAICCDPIRLFPGAKIHFSIDENQGARISFWKKGVFVSELSGNQMLGVDQVTIPDNCDSVSLTIYKNVENKFVNIWYSDTADDTEQFLALLEVNNMAYINPYLFNKSFSIMGDSISTYGGIVWRRDDDDDESKRSDGIYTTYGNLVRYPQEHLATEVDDMWWMRLLKCNKMKLISNESWAGSKVQPHSMKGPDGQQIPVGMVDDRRINLLTKDNKNPDIIFVFGGANDVISCENDRFSDRTVNYKPNRTRQEINGLCTNSFANAYIVMLMKIMQQYPDAEIICIIPYFFLKNNTTSSITPRYYRLTKGATQIIDICNLLGIKYVDLRKCDIPLYNPTNYIGDGVHANQKGQKKIFDEINRVIR
jgi:lysophospholipase L1-like esterase